MTQTDHHTVRAATPEVPSDALEVRRTSGVYALATIAAVALAIAYAARAGTGGRGIQWILALALLAVAAVAARGWWDARSPLLVADPLGVRLRRGRDWQGITWDEVDDIVLTPRRGLLHDGSIEVVTADTGYLVPLGLAAFANTADVAGTVRELGGPDVEVRTEGEAAAPEVIHEPELQSPAPLDDPLPGAEPTGRRRHLLRAPTAASATVRRSVRADIVHGAPTSVGTSALKADPRREVLPEHRELRGGNGLPDLVFDPLPAPVSAVALGAAPIEAYPSNGVAEPVIGPQIAAARERASLSIDDLADRTQIRPHVIEAIEVDDFAPCGGDFYARGHVRSLARVLGLDAGELVARHGELYAQAPIEARRVFEAELATGPRPSIRLARGGPNWAALAGVVLVLAIIWGIGHYVTAKNAPPASPVAPAPSVARNPDPGALAAAGAPTSNEILLRGKGAPTKVVVRDKQGVVIWRGTLATGQSHRVSVAGKATVVAAHGNAVAARVNGRGTGALGADAARTTAVLGRS